MEILHELIELIKNLAGMFNKEIQNYLDRFDKTVDLWINFLDQYSLDMLHRKPDPKSWSVGQVYSHIIEQTLYYIDEIKSALSSDQHSEKQMHAHARSMFDNDEFPDLRLTNPENDPDIPQPKDKKQLRLQLNELKEEIARIFKNSIPGKINGKTKHPGLQYFSAFEWLRFAEMHMRHHLRQKKRIDEYFRK